jgi:hypothetical protein
MIQFYLEKFETAEQVRVFNLEGKQIWQRDISSLDQSNHEIRINGEQWANGMYLIRLKTEQETYNRKVLKQ